MCRGIIQIVSSRKTKKRGLQCFNKASYIIPQTIRSIEHLVSSRNQLLSISEPNSECYLERNVGGNNCTRAKFKELPATLDPSNSNCHSLFPSDEAWDVKDVS